MDLREREDVAAALGRAEPLGGASTAGYLDDLGRRAPLDPAGERRLCPRRRRATRRRGRVSWTPSCH